MIDSRQWQIWCRTAPLPGGHRWRIAQALAPRPNALRNALRADLTISERKRLRVLRFEAKRRIR